MSREIGSPMTLADGKRGKLGQCKGPHCAQIVCFVFNPKTGKTSPYNVDPDPKTGKAVSHFATCVDVDMFRRPKGAEWA